jgi:hypothetical protein
MKGVENMKNNKESHWKKWGLELRKHLFFSLLTKFGEYNPNNPPETKEVIKFCRDFSKKVNKKYGTKLSENYGAYYQYKWAVSKPEKISHEHISTVLICKVAAYDVGFIDAKSLPSMILADWK